MKSSFNVFLDTRHFARIDTRHLALTFDVQMVYTQSCKIKFRPSSQPRPVNKSKPAGGLAPAY